MRGVWAGLVVSGFAVIGMACHDETSAPSAPAVPDSCSAPSRVVGDRCIEPGVADDGCPAGSIGLEEDGSCQPAGIPPGACGEGFVHDGDVGCEPILPAEPCPEGLMAVPGERACHVVMACGNHKWGNIPVEANTVYVDASYLGGDGNGSAQKPWTTIGDGVAAASPNGIVAIAAGEYVEDVVVSGKAVRLWGVCPEKVAIVGTGVQPGALDILRAQASGSEVRGLALVGNPVGLSVTGALDVIVESVWVHDSGELGVVIESAFGPTSVRLVGVLVEQNHGIGVQAFGTDVVIERSVVRDTLQLAISGMSLGRGINVVPDMMAAATVEVRGSLVERNHEVGIYVSSTARIESTVIRDTFPLADKMFGGGITAADVLGPSMLDVRGCLVEGSHDIGIAVFGTTTSIEATVVRDTLPQERDTFGGRAINIQPALNTGAQASVTVRASLIDRNREFAIFAGGGDTTFEGIVVRDTLPSLANGENGRGMNIQNDPTGPRASATLRGCRIERSREVGVLLAGADATVEATVVSDTFPQEIDATFGGGIAIQPDSGAPSVARLHASVFERNLDVGVYVSGSDVDIEGIVVRDTMPQESKGDSGRGINVQRDMTGTSARATLRTSLIERSHDIGIYFGGADATLEGIVIVDTLARASDDHFGDGLVFEPSPVPITMHDVRIENSARAALAIFGADVKYSKSDFLCQAFDVIVEAYMDSPYSLENVGDNRCGCPDADGDCILESAGFAAPEPLR